MADEKATPAPASPAKGKAEMVLVRLATAGANDSFVIPMADGEFTVTPQGVEVHPDKVETLLEIAAYNGVTLTVEPVKTGE